VQYVCNRGGGLALHPLNQQCTAKAKATGERCQRRVVGASVCWVHGLAAKQTRQKQEQRLLVYEAEAAAAAEPTVMERREPEELLLDLLDDVNRILQRIKAEMHDNIVSPPLLAVAGEWFDRTARVAKTVVDGDLSERLHRRIGWLAQDRASQLWGMLAAVLQAAPLTAQDRLLLWNSVETAARLVADGVEPLRLSPQEVRLFTSELEGLAAAERAAAEGVVWPESDSDSEPEPDSDSGEGVPFLFAVPADGAGL
jgi:hypothetical protein